MNKKQGKLNHCIAKADWLSSTITAISIYFLQNYINLPHISKRQIGSFQNQLKRRDSRAKILALRRAKEQRPYMTRLTTLTLFTEPSARPLLYSYKKALATVEKSLMKPLAKTLIISNSEA